MARTVFIVARRGGGLSCLLWHLLFCQIPIIVRVFHSYCCVLVSLCLGRCGFPPCLDRVFVECFPVYCYECVDSSNHYRMLIRLDYSV